MSLSLLSALNRHSDSFAQLPAGPSAARWKMHYEHAAAAYTVFALQLLAGEAASQSEDELLGNADTEEEVDELEESGAASNQGLPVSGITAPQEPTQLPASSGSAHHTITPVMRAHMVATQAPMVSPATQPQILEGSQQNVPTPAARAQAPAAPQTVTTEAPLSQPIFQPTLPGRTQDVATPVTTTPAATTTQLFMTPSGFIQNSSTLPQGTLAGQDGFQARAPITGEIKTSPQVADRPEDLTGRPQWSTRRVRRRTESITEASFSVSSQRRVEPPRRLRLATPLARDAIVLETQDSEFVAQQAEPSTHQPIDLADSSSSLSEPPETQPPLTWLPGGITLKQYRQRQTISVAGPSAGAQEPDGQPAVALNQLLAEAADVDTQSQMPVPPGRRPKPRKSRPPGGKAIRPSPPLVFEEAPDGRELSRIDTSDSKARSSSDSNHSSGVQAHSRSHESFRRSPSLHATPGPGDSDTSGLEDDWDQPTGGQESCGRRSSPRFALRFEGSPLGSAPGSVPSSTTTSSSAQVGHSGQRVSDTQSNAHLPGPALLGAPTQALSLTPSHHIGLSTQDLPSQWSESYESHLQSQLPSQSPSHPSSKHHPNFESQLHPQSKHNPKILGGEGPPERPEQAQMLSNERDFFTPASSSPSVSNASHLSGLSLGPTGALPERPAHRAPVLKSELYTRTQQSGSQAEGETPWTQPAVPPLVDTLQQVDSLPYRSLIQEPPLPNSFTQLQTVEEAITPASARTGGMPPATPSLHAVGKERESPAPAAPQSNASRSTRGTKRTVSLSMVAQSRGHDDVLHGRPPKRMRARGFSAASGRNERSRSAATTTSASTSASIPVSISNMTQAEAYRRQLRALRHDYGLMRHHAEYWLGPQMSITHARRQIEARFNEVLAANPLLRREKVERLFAVVEGDPTLFARSLRQFGWE